MSPANRIVQNASLTGAQVEALRAAVGWDRMAGDTIRFYAVPSCISPYRKMRSLSRLST